jgi:serine protease Do
MLSFATRGQTPQKHTPLLADFSAAVEELVESVRPAVVQIDVRVRAPLEGDDGGKTGFLVRRSATGSGVIVDPSGFIVTNAHVVEGARDIDVSVMDKKSTMENSAHKHFTGRIVGLDKETDLAVVKIEAEDLSALQFVDSDKLKQGQIVFALGSPLGLQNTLTVGYVSASARQLKADQSVAYIQTDAPINPGNSGGPLLDIEGRIAGINTLILSQGGGSEGIGFAIPANLAKYVYEQLRKEGHIHRGTVGIVAQDITPEMSKALGLNRHPGVIISDVVPHGSAAAAGIEQNDVVLAVDGHMITDSHQVQAEVRQHPVGGTITFDLLRGNQKIQKSVAVLERPNSPLALADMVNGKANLVRELGVLALTLDEKVTPSLPETRRLSGVVVAAIPAEFAALNPGFEPGDLIYTLNNAPVRSLEELRSALAALKPGDAVALLTEHEGTLGYVSTTIE